MSNSLNIKLSYKAQAKIPPSFKCSSLLVKAECSQLTGKIIISCHSDVCGEF